MINIHGWIWFWNGDQHSDGPLSLPRHRWALVQLAYNITGLHFYSGNLGIKSVMCVHVWSLYMWVWANPEQLKTPQLHGEDISWQTLIRFSSPCTRDSKRKIPSIHVGTFKAKGSCSGALWFIIILRLSAAKGILSTNELERIKEPQRPEPSTNLG